MIKVIYNKVCGRCVQSEPLTSGMVGQPIHFEYSHDFDGLTLTAVFTNGKTTVDVLNPGNQCVIPHEVLDTVGTLVKVGIYAVRGNELVIPTVYANIGIVLKGADPSGDVSADPTLPVWAQIQGIIGNLNDLSTEAKNNLVAAINEAAQTGSGGGSISTTAKNLLITILRSGVYTYDQSNNITALETALGGGEVPDVPDVPVEPDVPVVKTYTITRELINLTSNNNQNSISEGASYTATLSPNGGYLLPSTLGGSVTITMGGTDITSEVYNYDSGEIAITSVTGNIVIQATAFAEPKLIEDGLESFFDLRSAGITTSGNYKYIGATSGNGGLFYNNVDKEVTGKGIVFGTDRPTYTLSGNIEWNDYAGTDNQYTIVTCYYAHEGHKYSVPFPNAVLSLTYPNWYPTMKYINTSGTAVTVKSDVPAPSAQKAGFMVGAVSVGADKAVFATADGVQTTIEASNCNDFSSFAAYNQSGVVNPNTSTDSVTFYAVYNRALSIAEMTEVRNYMITEANK